MEKMQEEFEEWFKRDYHPDKTGPYMKDALLYAWKASRAAMCVDLPKRFSDERKEFSSGFDVAVEHVMAALHESGVRYK